MYAEFAYLYHLTHSAYWEDIDLVLWLAQQASGTILELGCGTGRLLLPIAAAGIPVLGLDNSAEMLAIAKELITKTSPKTQELITLVSADMQQFYLGKATYPLVIISHNTLMHFDTQGMARVLACVHTALNSKGLLYLDLANPFLLLDNPDETEPIFEQTLIDHETETEIDQFSRNWLDTTNQVFHIDWDFKIVSAQKDFPAQANFHVAYHYLFPHELELHLKAAGFQLKNLFGEYSRTPFTEAGSRMIALAQKL